MNPLLFLDIDGVLNTHDANQYSICGIHTDKVARLNRIVEMTGAHVVISSAWRYMILGHSMTVDGFRYMLVTHGLASHVRIVGHTRSDEEIRERGDQIAAYLTEHDSPAYIVLDDGSETPQGPARTMTQSLGDLHGEKWILIDGAVGLTDADAALAVHVLRAQEIAA